MKIYVALACLLLSGSALAADKVESAWFIPLSLVALEGDTSRVNAGGTVPSLSFHTQSAYGLAAGLGYRNTRGFEFAASLLHVKQEVDASWSAPTPGNFSYDSARVGLMFSVNIPLGGK